MISYSTYVLRNLLKNKEISECWHYVENVYKLKYSSFISLAKWQFSISHPCSLQPERLSLFTTISTWSLGIWSLIPSLISWWPICSVLSWGSTPFSFQVPPSCRSYSVTNRRALLCMSTACCPSIKFCSVRQISIPNTNSDVSAFLCRDTGL